VGIGARFERSAAAEGVDQGLLGSGPVVGGARLRLHRGRRRPRRARAARGAQRGALAERPVVVHAATVKGKGFAPAEEAGSRGWRSGTPPSPSRSRTARPRRPRKAPARKPAKPAPPQYTKVFGEAMVRECERDPRVVGITAAMNSGHRAQRAPEGQPRPLLRRRHRRAERGAAGPAGLSLQGAKPVCAIYSTFLQRAVRPDRPRRLPPGAERRLRDGPGRAGRG
jgi:hypothetical protein